MCHVLSILIGDLPIPNRNRGVGSEGEWREEPGREKEGKLRLGYKYVNK